MDLQQNAAATEQIRVLHVYKIYYPDMPGGIQHAIRTISLATARRGVRNTIFTVSHSPPYGELSAPEGQVLRYPVTFELASCPTSRRALFAFREQAAAVDLVHYHFPWPFADLLDYLRPAHVPALVTYHSDIVRQRNLLRLYRPMMRRFLSRMSRIVATSNNYLMSSESLCAHAGRTAVIPLGLEEQHYPPPEPARVAHWEQRFGRDFFLFIGVLRYYKGLHILLEAARAAAYPILIVGAGPTEAALRAQARELGLDTVRFLGPLPEEDKVALLSLCRALVFPSHLRSEAFGLSIVEAAMFAKPMISSEIGTGTSFVNVHNETGLVVPPSDAAALRAAMDALHADVARAAAMGRAARRRFERYFTAERMGGSYVALYGELLAGRR